MKTDRHDEKKVSWSEKVQFICIDAMNIAGVIMVICVMLGLASAMVFVVLQAAW